MKKTAVNQVFLVASTALLLGIGCNKGSDSGQTSLMDGGSDSATTDATDEWLGQAGFGGGSGGQAGGTVQDSGRTDGSLLVDVKEQDSTPVDDAQGQEDAAPIDADFSYDAGNKTPWETLPSKCRDAAEKGVQWLASMQKPNGQWGTTVDIYTDGATALAITKLETYAVEHGRSPFDPTFEYAPNIRKGFEYLFTRLKTTDMTGNPNDTNGNGKGVTNVSNSIYVTSLALMAVTAGQGFEQVVNSPTSPLHGTTFQQVAQDMVDHLANCQEDNGGWRYTCRYGSSDNSHTQYVTLALEYAQHPDYQFFCTIPGKVSTELAKWVTYIQNADGSSGYSSPGGGWSPIYRTGALLQEFAFMKRDVTDPKVALALDYVDKNFEAAYGSAATPHYMAMWAIMKGLVTQGIDKVGARDWYQEYCDKLVADQKPDGSWPLSEWDSSNTEAVLSSSFALLVLEKAAPAKAY